MAATMQPAPFPVFSVALAAPPLTVRVRDSREAENSAVERSHAGLLFQQQPPLVLP
jgi:hypothetical protein